MAVGGRGFRLVVNQAEIDALFARTGPVARDVQRKAERVAQEQKRLCPTSPDGSHGRPSGYLRSSIGWDMGADRAGPYADIGSPVEYALFVELGTGPHVIESHGPWPLRDKHGNVFGRVVHHPGTPQQPYLRPSLNVIATG